MNRIFSLSMAMILVAAVWGETPSPLACITEMELPQPQGTFVNITGEVTATVGIGQGGLVKTLKVRSETKILRNEVEYLLTKRTQYSASCAGQSVELEFAYVLEGEPARKVSGRVVFRAPNRFVIISRPFIPIIEFEKK